MKYLKIIMVLLFLQMSTSAFAMIHEPGCDGKINPLINETAESVSATNHFLEIMEFYEDSKSRDNIQLADLAQFTNLCKQVGALNVDRKPSTWKGVSQADLLNIATADCLKKIKINQYGR